MYTPKDEEKLLMTAFYSAMRKNRMVAELMKDNPTASVMARYHAAESDYVNARENYIAGSQR